MYIPAQVGYRILAKPQDEVMTKITYDYWDIAGLYPGVNFDLLVRLLTQPFRNNIPKVHIHVCMELMISIAKNICIFMPTSNNHIHPKSSFDKPMHRGRIA